MNNTQIILSVIRDAVAHARQSKDPALIEAAQSLVEAAGQDNLPLPPSLAAERKPPTR